MEIVVRAQLWGGVCEGERTDEWQRPVDYLGYGWSQGIVEPVWLAGK